MHSSCDVRQRSLSGEDHECSGFIPPASFDHASRAGERLRFRPLAYVCLPDTIQDLNISALQLCVETLLIDPCSGSYVSIC